MCDHVYAHTRVLVSLFVSDQYGSDYLRYFTFLFRQRMSRLAPNEPITGSSIWCVLHDSLGSTISTDKGWERCVE